VVIRNGLPLFEAAFAHACDSGEQYLAGDAAHMCALAVSEDRAGMEEWTQRGLGLAEQEPAAAYWAGPLLNNLGWAYFDAGEHERALELFERALEVRKRDPENQDAIAVRRGGRADGARRARLARGRLEAVEPVVGQRFPRRDGRTKICADVVRRRIVDRRSPDARRLRVGPPASEQVRAACSQNVSRFLPAAGRSARALRLRGSGSRSI